MQFVRPQARLGVSGIHCMRGKGPGFFRVLCGFPLGEGVILRNLGEIDGAVGGIIL